MKKTTETKKTEGFWRCEHCNTLNDLEATSCSNCGAPRPSEAEIVEVTTDFEKNETTVTSTPMPLSHNFFHVNGIRALVILTTVLITVITFVMILISLKNLNRVTVTEKYWTYAITVAEQKYVHKTTYAIPPHAAENVTSEQVRQDNGWDRTEYQYDILEWVTTETREIKGYDTPPTHEEYKLNEGEKIVSRTEDEFVVILVGSKGTRSEKVTKKQWLSYTVGNSYPDP